MTVFFVHNLLPGLYRHPIQKYLENGGVGVGVVVVIGRRVLEWVYLFERLLTSVGIRIKVYTIFIFQN